MTFKVIDTKTGKEPTRKVLTRLARTGGLLKFDIDQFFVGEDGSLILIDDCGNSMYVDMTRFKVVTESEDRDENNNIHL